MGKVEDNFECIKADNGWIIRYYSGKPIIKVYHNLEDMMKFIKSRWK